ncbi:MAG TPA: tetratricopeptide repeat protein, partial [Verrucomicrobiae bacterium]|nr:tetratricopeptide repeat protein [Verrucomicrobiae bacterium]
PPSFLLGDTAASAFSFKTEGIKADQALHRDWDFDGAWSFPCHLSFEASSFLRPAIALPTATTLNYNRRMKQLGWIAGVALFTGVMIGFAAGPDDLYVEVFRLIKQADDMNETGQSRGAYEQYLKARGQLRGLQTNNPAWNPKIVEFRLGYIAEKLSALESKSPEVKAPKPQLAGQPASTATEQEVQTLRDEVRRLSADRAQLEAKLREALTAQPAAVDPHTVAQAEERLREARKENEVLKATIEQQKNRLEAAGDPQVLEQTRRALGEANKKLSDQEQLILSLRKAPPVATPAPVVPSATTSLSEHEKLVALQKENDFLKSQLADVRAAGGNPAKVEDLTRQLKQARAELEAQKSANESLRKEQKGLEKQLAEARKTAKASAASVAELEKEKAGLEKKLEKRLAVPANASPEEVERVNRVLADKEKIEKQLVEARETARQNQSVADDLRKEKAALQSRLDEESKSLAKARQADLDRMKKLEKERDDLQKRLDTLSKASAKPGSRDAKQLDNEVASLRSRLDALEAKKVPFTPEELALFKEPQGNLALVAAAETKPAKTTTSQKRLSPEAGMLVAEAQSAFKARRYEEAETKYREVLKQDDHNTTSLYNLAVIQMEQNRYDEAEANLKKALEEAGDDSKNWSLFGILKFKEKKIDDAFDALSRAARLDPNNPETQNYLGITLSEKGQRVPAEAALRKAIQLSPNYGSAHHNLAIIYITQKPPFTELARWHYQKAISAGHPHNPELEKLLDQGTPTAAEGSK